MTDSKSIGIGMIGLGTVGGGVATLLRERAAVYAQRLGRPVELRRVLVRDTAKSRGDSAIDSTLLTADAEAFFNTEDMPIVVEVAGGTGAVGDYVYRALETGRHVVTANKSLLAARGAELFALAQRKGVCIAFEASCGGGIPIITALRFGLMANRLDAMYGILNGTCNYILTEMTQRGASYDKALKDAQRKGYAEADPAMDVSGQDAAQKLAILAALAFGVSVAEAMVSFEGINGLDLADIKLGRELGYDIKLLAIAERRANGGDALSLRVHPCFVHEDAMIAQVHGSFNALSVYGHAVGHTFYYGRGAGRMPTASAVVSDLLNIADGWYPQAFAALHRDAAPPPVTLIDADELKSRYYLRVNAMDKPGVMAKVTQALGEAGISLSAVIQHEQDAGRFVPLAITTHEAREGPLRAALRAIEQLPVINGPPVCLRIVDMPKG